MQLPDKEGYLKISEVCRPGKAFIFQIGIDLPRLNPLLQRVKEAYARFSSLPLAANIASALEDIVLVSSIHGTNSIEGGLLTEAEVKNIIDSKNNFTSGEEQKKRILNLKAAYSYAEHLIEEKNNPDPVKSMMPHITEQRIKELHRLAMVELMPKSELGCYRTRSRNKIPTKVGDSDHGGVYTPPICVEDIQQLMRSLLIWLNSEPVKSLPALYTAPLLHYYFERIHPFTDGNGRVGRILEAIQLRLTMGKFAAYGIWQYYWENIDEYFNVFNRCRKAEQAGAQYPNTFFVEFVLKGMLKTINRLHDRANDIIGRTFFDNNLNQLVLEKKLNARQHFIVRQLSTMAPLKRAELNQHSWYNALYSKLTKQTKSRDLRGLLSLKLIYLDKKDDTLEVLTWWKSKVVLSEHPDTQPDQE